MLSIKVTVLSNRVIGNKYAIVEKYITYLKTYRSRYESEYDSQFEDYRQRNQKARDKYVNEKLFELRISMKLKQLNRDDLLKVFDATSIYPSAMVDGVYPKIETGYAFTKDMNESIVNQFNSCDKLFASAILKIKNYNPEDIVIQPLPFIEEVKKMKLLD